MTIAVSPFQSLSISRTSSLVLSIFTLLFLSVLVSRGFFELLMPKKLAMMIHLVFVFLLSIWLFFPSAYVLKQRQKAMVWTISSFLVIAFLSSFLTSSLKEVDYWTIYIAFNLVILFLAFFMLREFDPTQLEVPYTAFALIIGWGMLLISFAEQSRLFQLPGESWIFVLRPAALTGSFLHYPLIMTFLAYTCIQWGKLAHSRIYFWSGVVFCSSTLFAASRSGLFIVLFTPLIFPFMNRFNNSKKIIFFFTILTLTLLYIAFSPSIDENGSMTMRLLSRISSAAKAGSLGNTGRIMTWKRIFNDWLGTNWFIGEYTGIVTNATSNLKGGKANVAESGFLQLLINFGIIGMILFYGILFQAYRFIKKEHVWLKCFFIAAIVQTLFYQSIEVLPYMVLMMMLPVISQSMAYRKLSIPLY